MASDLNKQEQESGIVESSYNIVGKENNGSLASSKLSKKESFRLQKQSYKLEKKKAENEFKMIAQNPAVVILADWLKVRNNLKKWSRMWCVLNPGMLMFYKNSKLKNWIATVLLASVEIIERPTKKQGMCFKIYHILNQSIWASKGPKGETPGILFNSLPGNYIILRAQTDSDGQCWVDALELAKKCSNLLKKSLNTSSKRKIVISKDKTCNESGDMNLKQLENLSEGNIDFVNSGSHEISGLQEKLVDAESRLESGSTSCTPKVSVSGSINEENEVEKNLLSLNRLSTNLDSSLTSSCESLDSDDAFTGDESIALSTNSRIPTIYVPDEDEELGESGETAQVEELEGENKSLVWTLLKQIKPGMDLSKVVLPTFILEPRSFLDKLSDYYYHADLIAKAALEQNAYNRMKLITKWYLSGFYKKPKGLKKPYNPIIGETFRCKWDFPDGSSLFYIAEQISHHPPISALAVINRKAGFTVHGTILAKSKFYGNSLSAILDGNIVITLLDLGEEYVVTLPYAHCKGILYGKMTMEFGGKIKIQCEKTGYATEIEFKLKRLFGGTINEVSGRILLGSRVLGTFNGCWDQAVHFTDLNKGTVEEFWSVTKEVKKLRLQRYTVEPSLQGEFESANLWKHVAAAIIDKDQVAATEHKAKLEERQRKEAKLRKENGEVWIPKYFEYNFEKDQWEYKYLDTRPWDSLNDIYEFESEGVIQTKTKHKSIPLRKRISQKTHSRKHNTKELSEQNSYQICPKPGDLPSQKTSFGLQQISGIFVQQTQSLAQKQKVMLSKIATLEKSLIKIETLQRKMMFAIILFMFIVLIIAMLIFFSFVSSRESNQKEL